MDTSPGHYLSRSPPLFSFFTAFHLILNYFPDMPSTTDSTARLGPNRDVNDGGSELSQATRGTEKKTGLSVGAKIGMWVGMNM